MGLQTLAIGSLVAGGIGTAVSAAGAIENGQAQAASASYQAQVARNNATIASQNARSATEAGQEKAATESLQSRAQLGAAVSNEAASGVEVDSGSPADVNVSDREFGKLDTLQVVNNAALQAYGYRSQATSFEADAGLDASKAADATTAGAIGATGSLLSGAASLSDRWVQFQNKFGSNSSSASGAVGGSDAL